MLTPKNEKIGLDGAVLQGCFLMDDKKMWVDPQFFSNSQSVDNLINNAL